MEKINTILLGFLIASNVLATVRAAKATAILKEAKEIYKEAKQLYEDAKNYKR